MRVLAFDQHQRGRRIRELSDPIHDGDAVTLRYLNGQLAGVGSGGGSNYVVEDVISSVGTSHTLSATPAGDAHVAVWLNGQRLWRVTAAPTSTEFIVAGTTVTTGHSLQSDDVLVASYLAAPTGTLIVEETLGTGTIHVLAYTPVSAASVAIFLNGQRLERVASGATALQFSVSTATVTTGYSVTSGDTLAATYLH